MPGLARCIEALQASELSRIHKEQFKETFDSPNTVHAAEKYHSAKERRKGNSGSSDGNLRGRNKSGKEKPSVLCKFCGTEHSYDRAKCPASGKTCHKCGKQGHFAVKCHVKRQSSSKPDNKVHQTSGAHQRFTEHSDEADDSIFILERVGLVSSNVTRSSFMVRFTFHIEYSPTVKTQLDTGATCSAMSYEDLLNILQLGQDQLDPPAGRIRIYDGSVVNPLGSYTFSVSRNSGPK